MKFLSKHSQAPNMDLLPTSYCLCLLCKITRPGTSRAVQWVRLSSQSREPQVQSLVRKLRSHIPHGANKTKKKPGPLSVGINFTPVFPALHLLYIFHSLNLESQVRVCAWFMGFMAQQDVQWWQLSLPTLHNRPHSFNFQNFYSPLSTVQHRTWRNKYSWNPKKEENSSPNWLIPCKVTPSQGEPICKTGKEAQIERTDVWTQCGDDSARCGGWIRSLKVTLYTTACKEVAGGAAA